MTRSLSDSCGIDGEVSGHFSGQGQYQAPENLRVVSEAGLFKR